MKKIRRYISTVSCLLAFVLLLSGSAVFAGEIVPEGADGEIIPYASLCGDCGGRMYTKMWWDTPYGVRSCPYGYTTYDQYANKLGQLVCSDCGSESYVDLIEKGNYCRHLDRYY